MFKNWWCVAKPSKGIFWGQFITAAIANVLHTLATIPAAKVITSLTEAKYAGFDGAYFWLVVGFSLLLLRNIFWHVNFLLFPKQIRHVYMQAQRGILSKIFAADEKSLKINSKEKIINTIASNIYNCGEFADFVTYKSAYLFRALITLVIVLTTNWMIGLVLIAINVVIFFILRVIYRHMGIASREIATNKDAIFEGFSDIVDSRVISNDLNINEMLQKDYEDRSELLMKSYKKKNLLKSYRDNWIFVVWNLIIMVATIYLVNLVKADTMTLTLYLIITPYMTTAIDYFVAFYNVFYDLENVNVSTLRLATIYSMSENELVEFGENTTDKIEGKVQFYDVTYDPSKRLEGCSVIKDVSLLVKEGEIALIQGARQSGKRTLFYLLRRAIKPCSGMVTIGDINIYDYERKSYVHNMSYVTSTPYFFNSSIMGNLKYIEQNEKKVKKVCKDLGIYDTIEALPNGFDTNMTTEKESISEFLTFMIGLARVVLSKSEVVMVYEFPRLASEEQAILKQKLLQLKKGRSIIIFSANNSAADIADKHFIMERGSIRKA